MAHPKACVRENGRGNDTGRHRKWQTIEECLASVRYTKKVPNVVELGVNDEGSLPINETPIAADFYGSQPF